MDETAIIDVFKHMRGKGPQPWRHVLEEWQFITHGTATEFNQQVLDMHARYPERLIINRPYNVSQSPTLEVPK